METTVAKIIIGAFRQIVNRGLDYDGYDDKTKSKIFENSAEIRFPNFIFGVCVGKDTRENHHFEGVDVPIDGP